MITDTPSGMTATEASGLPASRSASAMAVSTSFAGTIRMRRTTSSGMSETSITRAFCITRNSICDCHWSGRVSPRALAR